MEPQRLFSRRSVIASVGALVARIVYPGARGVEAAASAAPPLSAASPRPALRVDPVGQVTYFVFDREGRLVSERVETTYVG